ncbi:hypothetical protein [Angustibacter aerolatus]|uniref:Uncharacterized protein n=1 Tax=Angustibacter aerolatus TaxID=1162965 RepID=A0ABQ6JGG5_9ACTN|nr:hypothetical protein [Angustibacter aerolatus]GMA86641.1 hypothetical protein GCM10025868_18910 [Angustibacter aerolatus]
MADADDRVEIDVEGSGEEQAAKVESAQDVADRVRSWQAGAPVDTVREELERAFAKAGLSPDAAEIEQMAQRISDEQGVDVEQG